MPSPKCRLGTLTNINRHKFPNRSIFQAFDVSLYLPDLRQLKHLTERYKNLGQYVVLEASRRGRLRLSVETDPVSVVTHFQDLESPRYDDTVLSSLHPGVAGDSRLQQRINESLRAEDDEEGGAEERSVLL